MNLQANAKRKIPIWLIVTIALLLFWPAVLVVRFGVIAPLRAYVVMRQAKQMMQELGGKPEDILIAEEVCFGISIPLECQTNVLFAVEGSVESFESRLATMPYFSNGTSRAGATFDCSEHPLCNRLLPQHLRHLSIDDPQKIQVNGLDWIARGDSYITGPRYSVSRFPGERLTMFPLNSTFPAKSLILIHVYNYQ